MPGQKLHRRHVDLIEIGALLAIDFDADEMFVEYLADLGILEAFMFHDVAPVARRVTNAQEDRAVELLGFAQRFFAPGMPVYGIVRMLLQIRAGFVDQPIGLLQGSLMVAVP